MFIIRYTDRMESTDRALAATEEVAADALALTAQIFQNAQVASIEAQNITGAAPAQTPPPQQQQQQMQLQRTPQPQPLPQQPQPQPQPQQMRREQPRADPHAASRVSPLRSQQMQMSSLTSSEPRPSPAASSRAAPMQREMQAQPSRYNPMAARSSPRPGAATSAARAAASPASAQQQQQPQMRINRHGSISIGPGLSPLEQSLRRGTPP